MLTGDRARIFPRIHAGLICALGAASLWSTALTEAVSLLLILVFVVAQGFGVKRFAPEGKRSRLAVPACLLLLGIHVAAVVLSMVLSGVPFAPFAGRAWRPLLLVVTLLSPLDEGDIVLAGKCLFVSGLCAAGTTLAIHVAQGDPVPLSAFIGLTTFADLLVVTAVVGIALLVGRSWRNHPGMWILAAELVVVFALFWTAERAPVALFALAAGALFVSLRPRFLPAWAMVIGGFFLLGPLALRDKFEWLIRFQPLDRYVVWEEGLRLLGHVPVFGHGPGSYEHLLPAGAWGRFNNRPPSSWHNDLLQVSLDNGPVAALAFAGILAVTLSCAVKAFSVRPPGRVPRASSYPGVLFFILTILGIVGSVATTALLGDVFWILAGMTVQAGCRAMDA